MNNKIYDLANLKSMIGDDETAIKEFVSLFIETSAETLEELNQAFQSKDFSQVGSLAHKLKSSIDLMGIESLKEEIRKIERIGKEMTDLELLPTLIEKLNDGIEIARNEMKKDILD
ncbi:MAG TPA: Hpt domain-containing protein [Bacteroidia bacterium]|nr:Hpt domain-containing protein [Sphingobacteriales bacterium]HPD64642.1 Hpt domain-containing protein [Bacteroidia bacterium]HRS58476.1 Hpt domain-containing protein [Bacteroidia bacterium]HRU68393.1 Hpt domain-containing protein [Bacteroidia bacterium]